MYTRARWFFALLIALASWNIVIKNGIVKYPEKNNLQREVFHIEVKKYALWKPSHRFYHPVAEISCVWLSGLCSFRCL